MFDYDEVQCNIGRKRRFVCPASQLRVWVAVTSVEAVARHSPRAALPSRSGHVRVQTLNRHHGTKGVLSIMDSLCDEAPRWGVSGLSTVVVRLTGCGGDRSTVGRPRVGGHSVGLRSVGGLRGDCVGAASEEGHGHFADWVCREVIYS